jgi:hypothetical protein
VREKRMLAMATATEQQPKQRQSPFHRFNLGSVTRNNVNQLRQLNAVLFPVRYNKKFYDDALLAGELCQLGGFHFIFHFNMYFFGS